MAPSWFQILIVVVLLVLLFGRGKISELMGDVAKGIKSFKKGISEDEEKAETTTHKSIEHDAGSEADTKRHTREEANTST
ncbi:MAG: twin-arginine translocase TatA/TatE family subunit [Dichotomicrobium sp.]